MIRKNDNTRKELATNNINLDKSASLKHRVNSHTLIYNIGQYRKSITNIAIGCVRKQSVGLIDQIKQPKFIVQKDKLNEENNCPDFKLKGDYNSTKKKKYNYGVKIENQMNGLTNQYYLQKNLIFSASKNNQRVDISKSYSFISKRQKLYITAPFNVQDNQQKSKYSHQQSKNTHLSLKNLHQLKCVPKINNYYGKNIQLKQICQKNIDKISFESINLERSRKKLNEKPVSQEKTFFRDKETSKTSIQKKNCLNLQKPSQSSQSVCYPKTQTYTSRSEYNIQKLSNKLDSYIQKHIKNT